MTAERKRGPEAGAGRPARLRAGDDLELTVEKGVYRGQGLARHQGRVVFVPGGLPGDRLRVRLDTVHKDYARGTIEEVLEASSARRDSPCSFSGLCGGCSYQELDYEAQLRLKVGVLEESLSRAGVEWAGSPEIVPSPERGWRSRARLHVRARGRTLRLGLHQPGSNRVVDIDSCLQLSDAANGALSALRANLEGRIRQATRIQSIELAEGVGDAGLVVALESDLPSGQAVRLAGLATGIDGLSGLGVLPGRGGRKRYLNLKGEPFVRCRVSDLSLRVHVRSFFQANRFVVEELVREVVEQTPGGGTVLDLYAGVGLFGLALAPRAERVLGAEHSATAVADAGHNAQRAGLGNVSVQRRDVVDALAAWPGAHNEDVILDPPRTGAEAAVLGALVKRKPRTILYVSCDPPTLARDIRKLATAGYAVASLRAFDMFPDTFHVETVAVLRA